MKNIAQIAVLAGVLGGSAAAWAQAEDPELGNQGFALDRFDPADKGSEWFALDSVNQSGHVRPAFGLVLDYARKPLVLVNSADEDVAGVVDNQLYAHLGGSVVVLDRLRFGVNIPVLLVNTGAGGTLNGVVFETREGAGVGDLRIAADYRFFGNLGDHARVSAGLRLHVPTGASDAFAGDGKFRVTPQVMFAGDHDRITYGARLGIGMRFREGNFAGETFNGELQIGLGAGYRFLDNRALLVGPELLAAPALSSDGDGAFGNTNPVELLLGAHYTINEQVRVGLGAGPGLASGFGSPAYRLVANVEWSAVGPKDGDSDGIYDERDACPTIPGPGNGDPKLHGCPVQDMDSDGVFDAIDACVNVPGVRSDDPMRNGCPLDGDGDGIGDMYDACPRDAGPSNPDPTRNGCPMAKIDQGQILISEQVQFETGSAQIRAASDKVLQAVLTVLHDHPEITLVSVEGHTDNRGTRELNIGLSRDRAASVVQWLVYHGVSRDRLTSSGFGPDKPLADNNSEAGRQKNRRVEFHINPLTTNAQPVNPAAPGPLPAATPAASPTSAAPAPSASGGISVGGGGSASTGAGATPTVYPDLGAAQAPRLGPAPAPNPTSPSPAAPKR